VTYTSRVIERCKSRILASGAGVVLGLCPT
jgi:hypothetical protein